MSSILGLLLSQGYASAFGWSIVTLLEISVKRHMFCSYEKFVLSYVVGMALLPLYMVLLFLMGRVFSPLNLFIFAPVPFIVFFIYSKKKKAFFACSESPGDRRLSVWERVFAGGIIFEAFHSLFRAMIKPIESFDSVASFAIKAKIFYLSESIPADFFKTLALEFPHPSYPLMIPLQETFVFLSMNSFNDLLVKIIFPAHFIALLGLFYFTVKVVVGRKGALLATFLMASMNELNRFSAMGYTDIHFSLYISMALMFTYRYLTSGRRERVFLILAGLFSGFSAFTKDAGLFLPILTAILFIVSIMDNKKIASHIRGYVAYLGISAVVVSPWIAVRMISGFDQDFVGNRFHYGGYVIERIIAVLYEFQVNVFNPKKWILLWPVFIVLFIINFKWSLKTELKYITWSIFSLFVFYFIFYIVVDPLSFGIDDAYRHSLRSSMHRHLIHVVPIVMFWMALVFKKANLRKV